MSMHEPLIFDLGCPGRTAESQILPEVAIGDVLPNSLLRQTKPKLPEVSELQVVRHYTRLSKLNFAIDTNFYPLGSCTMKYNPRSALRLANLAGFLTRHPYAQAGQSQAVLHCFYELQNILQEVMGMKAVCLSPMAGAQGEFVGIAMIRAYHNERKDYARTEMLIPDAAHGTNPASAAQCGYTVKEVPTKPDGDLDIEALKAAVGPQTAGIMLTNPSTLGVFERDIQQVAKIVHDAGGLLYYDGANLNAILGKVPPGDMGFDVMHMNLHKTFATPHGGGGPGSGPVAVGEKLIPYLPVPYVVKDQSRYRFVSKQDCPKSIGRLSCFMGNAGILLRAYFYARLLGRDGLHRVSEFATLNANYLMARLKQAGFEVAYPERRATHEFIVTLKKEAKQYQITALDFAKRLLDKGFHAPTMYFPLLVPECLLIEPTETESLETLDHFVSEMSHIYQEMQQNPNLLKNAPHCQPVRRLDEVKAARALDLVA